MLNEKMTVKEAIKNAIKFDRVNFVNKDLEGKSWMAASFYPTNEELVSKYGDNICQQNVINDNEGFKKYSLVIWVDSNDEHLSNQWF